MTRLLAVALAFVVAAVPCRAETVRIARQFGLSYLPLIIMQDSKMLEAEGNARGLELVPEWITFTGGPPINDAMISGNIDLAAGGVGAFLTLWNRTRGPQRVLGVAAMGNMPMWLNTTRPEVKTIADLTDRDRIALPGVKVSIQAVVLQMAAEQLFGPGQAYRLDPLTVTMGHPDGEVALLSGNTEVTAHFTSAPFMYEELANPKVHRILNSYDVLGGPHTFNLVWATQRYRDAHPAAIEAFAAALEKALGIIRDHPDEAAAVWIKAEKSHLSQADVAAMLRRPENEWTTAPKRFMAFLSFMRGTGAVTQTAASWKDLFFPSAHALDGS